MAKNNNFRVVILIIRNLKSGEKLKLKKLSKELGFSIIESSQELNKYPLSEQVLCVKDIHPNKFGYRIIAISLFKRLVQFKWFKTLLANN